MIDELTYPRLTEEGSSSRPSYRNSGFVASSTAFDEPSSSSLIIERLQRPQDELASRSVRLKRFEWQLGYTEDELLSMYKKIAQVWGNQKTVTVKRILFPRVTKYFGEHPVEREKILKDDQKVIKAVAAKSGIKLSMDRFSTKPNTMTPKEIVAWIKRPKNARAPAKIDPDKQPPLKKAKTSATVSKEFDLPHWAKNWGRDKRSISKVLNRLVKAWGITINEVENRLSLITEQEMGLYLPTLSTKDSRFVTQSAQHLKNYINSKVQSLGQAAQTSSQQHRMYGNEAEPSRGHFV